MGALVVNQVWGKVPDPLKDRADATELLDRLPEPGTPESKQVHGVIKLGGIRADRSIGKNQQNLRMLSQSAGQSDTVFSKSEGNQCNPQAISRYRGSALV
jgi:hypothetical protein